MSLHTDEEKDREPSPQNSKLIAAEPEDLKQDVEDEQPPGKMDSMWKYLSCMWRAIIWPLLSIVMHLFDLGRDVYLAVKHYRDGHFWYFCLTLIFTIVPAIVTSFVSEKFYRRDRDRPTIAEGQESRGWWFARRCGLVLFLSPVIRCTESLYYSFLGHKAKSKQDKEKAAQYFARMKQEDAVASLLRLVESYLESAPQLVLHLYILEMSPEQHEMSLLWIVCQIVTFVIPVISMVFSLTSYNRILRRTQKDQHYISSLSSFALFSSHLVSIASRVLLLGCFASVYTWWIWPACLVHWAIMLIWIIIQRRNTCPMKLEEILFDMLISVVHLFTYFDLKTEKTRNLYIYCAICFGENIVLSVCTYTVFEGEYWWLHFPVTIIASSAVWVILLFCYCKNIHHIHAEHPPSAIILTKYAVCASTDNLADQGALVTIHPGSLDAVWDTAESSQESSI